MSARRARLSLGVEAARHLSVARELERAGRQIDHQRQLRLRPDRLVAHALAAQIEAQAARRQLSGQREARRRHLGERRRAHGDVGGLEPDAAARIVRRAAQAEATAELAAHIGRADAPEQGERQPLQRSLRRDPLRRQLECAGEARLAEAQVQILYLNGAASQGDGRRTGQAQRLLSQTPAQLLEAQLRALAERNAGAGIEVEGRVGLPARSHPDVQRLRWPLGADAALGERHLAPSEALDRQVGNDAGRMQGVGDAAAQLEPAEPPEIAREVAADGGQGDGLRAVRGRGARLELGRPRQPRRQQRSELAQLLDPPGQLALDQPALEIDRQVAAGTGARRAQTHVAEPELWATQLDAGRELGRDVPRLCGQAEPAVRGLGGTLGRGGERERVDVLAGDQQIGALCGELERRPRDGAAQLRPCGQPSSELQAEARRQRGKVRQVDGQRSSQRLRGQAELEPAIERGVAPLDAQMGDLDAVVRAPRWRWPPGSGQARAARPVLRADPPARARRRTGRC